MPSPPPRPPAPLVTVRGAAGFIGRFVVAELLQQGWRVRAFVRPSEENPFLEQPDVEVLRGDIRDPAAVARALTGAAAAVNLAGAKSDEPDSEAVNVGGARHLVAAARAHGGVRILHFSTQAVKLARPGLYARTKLAADRVFETSGLPVTILRPSIVYGPGRSGVFSTMQRAVERLPIVPVLGDGRWVSAPVHVADVARAVTACLATPPTIGRCYDLAGPDSLSLDALLDRIAGRRVRKLHLPFGVALLLARIAVRVLPRAPLSVSNVLGSNQPLPIDLAPARRDFGFNPMSLDAGLRTVAEGGSLLASDSSDHRQSTNHRLQAGSYLQSSPNLSASDASLDDEARWFARYLLRVDADPDLRQRYAAAVRVRFAEAIDGDLAFVRRHRWSLPCVDAVTAVIRPRSQVRQRLLLMAALLETSPQHAEFFLAPPPSRPALLLGLGARALTSAAKLAAGAVLLPFIRPHGVRR